MSNAADKLRFPTVNLPLSATSTPEAAVRFLVQQLVEAGRLRQECADHLVREVLKRESLGSTGVGRGVAIPHSNCDGIDDLLGVIGRCQTPMTWPGAVDGNPVSIICLLATPTNEPMELARGCEAFVRQLRTDPQ